MIGDHEELYVGSVQNALYDWSWTLDEFGLKITYGVGHQYLPTCLPAYLP